MKRGMQVTAIIGGGRVECMMQQKKKSVHACKKISSVASEKNNTRRDLK